MDSNVCKHEEPDHDLTKLFNVKDLSKYFNISEKTAYNLIRQRNFPSIKVGGQYRIIVDELVKWMDKQSKGKK